MMLSLTTDYFTDTGCAEPYLRRIAEAGFSRVHWCHEWDSDYVYSRDEVRQISGWLNECGLKVLDLHASAGKQSAWASATEESRRAGVELVRNRIEMAAQLGCDVIIMHVPKSLTPDGLPASPVRRSLDELQSVARRAGVRVAVENMANDTFDTLRAFFALYPPDYVGLCYDSGHGNIAGPSDATQGRGELGRMSGKGLDHLETVKDRLIAIHLHDNDGSADQHDILFNGTVDWPRLARILVRSNYSKCVSSEATMRRVQTYDERAWLEKAFAACTAFARMVEASRTVAG